MDTGGTTKMTRKDYELIAQTLRELREELENNQDNGGNDLINIEAIATRFCEVLSAENPNFKAERFLSKVLAISTKDITLNSAF